MLKPDLENLSTDDKPALSEVIEALQQDSRREATSIAPTVVYGLSDLARDETSQLAPIWRELPADYKQLALRQLNDSSEVSFELNFKEIALLSLEDKSELVRAAGADLLWMDESLGTMRRLMSLARDDASPDVRARALAGLGRYILRGEYGEIPTAAAREAQELALQMHCDASQSLEVRCRALEALANSNHQRVERLIREAYANGNHMLKISAIFAMGRSCDQKWRRILLDELDSQDSEMVYEAIQACGHIQIEEGLQAIAELTLSDDREIQMMAIWAVGEIGGQRAFEILSNLSETAEDDVLLEAIDEALDAASFSLSMPALGFEFDDR